MLRDVRALIRPAAPEASSPAGLRSATRLRQAGGLFATALLLCGGAVYTLGLDARSSQPPAGEGSAIPPTVALRGATEAAPSGRDPHFRNVETRLATLRRRQDELTERQHRLSAVLREAARREIEIEPVAQPRAVQGRGVVLAGFRPHGTGPRPVTGDEATLALGRADRPLAVRHVEELDAALASLEVTQQTLLLAVERALDERLARLGAVPRELGLDEPSTEAGGPFVELRGVEAPLAPLDPIESVRLALAQYDELRSMVDSLPVRAPIAGKMRLTSRFGRRVDPFLGRPAMHTGLDIAAAHGTPVRAPGAGTVRFAGWNGGYGRMIEIDHGNGHRTRFGHLARIDVAVGDRVAPGERIGAVGSSGRSTGPHLHYELVRDGRRRNPETYLKLAESGGSET